MYEDKENIEQKFTLFKDYYVILVQQLINFIFKA